jgi:two-component system chemotaxis sensor kinase CheA
VEGEETELDKTLIEAIRDPLTHLVRNAVDHGIELPTVRKARGKPEEGRLRVVAFHEGGKVIIEISDDGCGIDVDRVRAKAVSANLIKADAAQTLSPKELMRFIFSPGFSTAEHVTQFSGRGVGMDVVRTNIEKIGGSVDIDSTPGQGTTIRTKIPLTLAIIPALLIVCGNERFAIPQVNLLELVCFSPEAGKLGIEWLHGTPLYRLRGKLLPLVFLDEQLGLEADRPTQAELHIVVLSANDRPFGLVVDAICDTQEIVVKPLQKLVKRSSAFAGASIMGDGRVALVLDVVGIAHLASIDAAAQRLSIGEMIAPAQESVPQEVHQLLMFTPSDGGLMAIPLSLVARLEEFPRTMVASLGGRQVVNYGGEILPLFDVSHELARLGGRVEETTIDQNGSLTETSDMATVVVLAGGVGRVGLIVGAIVDIVADPIATRFRATRPGVMFTSVINERIVEFVDVEALVSYYGVRFQAHLTL